MKTTRFIAFCLLLGAVPVLGATLAACASAKKPDPQDTLRASMNLLAEAIAHNDVDAVMQHLAPAFYHPEIGHRDDAYATMLLATEGRSEGGFVLDLSAAEFLLTNEAQQAEVSPALLRGRDQVFRVAITLAAADDASSWQVLTFRLLE